MKPSELPRMLALTAALGLAAAGGPTAALAQNPSSGSEQLVRVIIDEVIGRTIEAAREEVRRNTGIDPLRRGYDPRRSYEPLHSDASDEARRELHQLNAEHDRTIVQLEEELHRKLDQAEAEFHREAAKEDKPDKVAEKRGKLQEQVDDAYAKFEEKIAEENARYDEKRHEMVFKERGG